MDAHEKIAKKLTNVENILNVSQNTIDALDAEVDVIEPTDIEIVEDENLPVEYDESVVSLTLLKKKFNVAQSSLQQLINFGQGLMAQTTGLELDELKASDIMAIAQLSDVVHKQLRSLIEMVKDITEIELNMRALRQGTQNPNVPPGSQLTQNNTYVVTGSTTDIIKNITDNLNGTAPDTRSKR